MTEKQNKAWKSNGKKLRATQTDFITKAELTHGKLYDYSNVKYKTCKTKVEIICKKHGAFCQSPDKHYAGRGCPKCGQIKRNSNRIIKKKEFIKLAQKIHGDIYDYSLLEDGDNSLRNFKIPIICKEHGTIYQFGADHLNGHGCRYCFQANPKIEQDIEYFLIENSINFIRGDRNILNGKELDFFIPKHNLAIEVNGLYWHSELAGKDSKYHLDKSINCEDAGIQLIHIFEDEVYNKFEILKSFILNKLNHTPTRIYARKCKILEISPKVKNDFLNGCHLQGGDKSKIKLGLYHGKELVSVMTFSGLRICNASLATDNVWELSRFANKINVSVVGGFSKLLKHFIKQNSPNKIISYADRRISNGAVYEKNNFQLDKTSPPSYFYFKKEDRRYHRFNFRKSVLSDKLDTFDVNLTEWENMKNDGWNRIWDCGCYRYSMDLMVDK